MGTDILGWVEFGIFWEHEQRTSWHGAIKIDSLIGRNYDMFYSLFGTALPGVRFPPVAYNRGTPLDASEEVKEMVSRESRDLYGHSWLTWQDIQAIDWEEASEPGREAAYVLPSEGTDQSAYMRYIGGGLQELFQEWTKEERRQWEETGRVTAGGVTYQRQIKRRDALRADWKTLFTMMEALAQCYGADKVRLVVMFNI
jgi:hypothetical protein